MSGVLSNRLHKKRQSELTFYWQYYGLNRDPFSSFLDEAMTLILTKWEQHLDIIATLIKTKNILISVLGKNGIGKTTLLKQFMHQVGDAYEIAFISADSLYTPQKLVAQIKNIFNLSDDSNSKQNFEVLLDNLISDIQHKDRTCVLVIDDGQYLPLETLQALLYLLNQQSETQMRLHIIMFGDPDMQAKLAGLTKQNLSDDMVHSIELESLTKDEILQYLQHRLNLAGLTGPIPFSKLQLERIIQLSDGVPEKVNRLAQQALLDSLDKGQASINSKNIFLKHKTRVIGISLLAVTLVITSYVMSHIGQYVLKAQAPQKKIINYAGKTQSVRIPENHSDQIQNLALKENTPKKPMIAVPGAGKNGFPDVIVASSQHPQNQVQEKRVSYIENIPASAIEAEQKQGTKKQIVEEHTKNIVKDLSQTKPHNKKESPMSHITVMEQRILKTKDNTYTLQLLALSEENKLKTFIAQHHIQNQAKYFKTRLEHGTHWYALIYGKYPNRAAAEKAAKNLPKTLHNYKPWIRSYKSVKEEMVKTVTRL